MGRTKRFFLTLTAGAGLSVPAGLDAQAQHEYVVVGSGSRADGGEVTTYALDRATGQLSQIDRKAVGQTVSFMALNPGRPVLYATDERGGDVHWITIDPATGAITPGGHQTGNGDPNPVYLSVDAAGTTLLSVNYGEGTVDAFPLDDASGAISGPPVNYVTGANSHSAVFHPSKAYVYVASVSDSHIAQYSFSEGQLQPLSPATVPQPGGPRHMIVHPSGDFLYAVAGPTDSVSAFRIGDDGTLSPLGTVPRLQEELSADAEEHMGSDIHVTHSGRFLYTANRGTSNTLAIYSIGDDGRLTLTGHESTQGSTPRNFALDPDGELALVGNQESRNISIFRIDQETGALTHLNTEDVGVTPWFVGMWMIPTGS